jgi:hypothetical protein
MIGFAIALMVIGIVFGFVIPWVGVTIGLVGLLLFIALVAGFGRRAANEPGR